MGPVGGCLFRRRDMHDAGGVSTLFATSETYQDPMPRMAPHPFDLQAVSDPMRSVVLEFQFESTSKSIRKGRKCGLSFCGDE